jgi:chromosome segregation ATPase
MQDDLEDNREGIDEYLESLDAIAELEKARTQTRSLSPDELIALLRPFEGDIDSLNLTVASLVQAFETIDEELKQLDRDAEDVLKDQAKKIGALVVKTTQLESCLKAQSERITALESAPKPFRLTRLKAAIALLVLILVARPDVTSALWKSTTKLVHPSMHKVSPQKKPATKHKAIVEGSLPHHP